MIYLTSIINFNYFIPFSICHNTTKQKELFSLRGTTFVLSSDWWIIGLTPLVTWSFITLFSYIYVMLMVTGLLRNLDVLSSCIISSSCTFLNRGLVLWCYTTLLTIFQLYRWGQFYWRRKPEYPQVTDKLVSSIPRLSGIRNHNVSCDTHWLPVIA
jgi:hypothetical protein